MSVCDGCKHESYNSKKQAFCEYYGKTKLELSKDRKHGFPFNCSHREFDSGWIEYEETGDKYRDHLTCAYCGGVITGYVDGFRYCPFCGNDNGVIEV